MEAYLFGFCSIQMLKYILHRNNTLHCNVVKFFYAYLYMNNKFYIYYIYNTEHCIVDLNISILRHLKNIYGIGNASTKTNEWADRQTEVVFAFQLRKSS